MLRTTKALASAALLAGLVLAGCGDDDTDATESDTTEEPTATPAADCEASTGETVTVEIGDFLFDPTPVEVQPCDSVVWTNTHDQAHTSTGNGTQTWNTGNLGPGDSSDPVLFETSGAQTYICALHPFMKGTVEVA
jgi:plastocyanin